MPLLREGSPEGLELVSVVRVGAAMTRPELIHQAVIEAARAFMAANLRWESGREKSNMPTLDALQELRDALAAQSKTRRA